VANCYDDDDATNCIHPQIPIVKVNEFKKRWDLNTNRYTVCIPQIGFLIIPILYGMRFLLDQPTVCCPCDHVMATGICVFIMIDTLFQYVYHCKNDGIFPQKMTLISYAIYCHCICGDVLCFYLIQKRKFLMIYMLSITRWITCEWRLLCGPHFLFLVTCSKTLCVTAPVVVVPFPFTVPFSINLSKWFPAPFGYCFFILVPIFAESIWRTTNVAIFIFANQ